MKTHQGILLFLSLMASLQFIYSYPMFRRYNNYNIYMQRMASHLEKAKVETLGAIFKRHVQQLRHANNKQVELLFLIDSSGTVGRQYFYEEVRFVKNLLADFTVDMNTTRVSIITFSSPHKIYRHIDYLTHPHMDNHKCRLLHEDIPDVTYTPGGTYTLGALLEAQKVLRSARSDASKVIFLMTDGYSNGGDPRPIAHKLKAQGVKIFTFGIRNGFVWELRDMASHPKNETCYILDSFEEFEALAKRALHADLQRGSHIEQSVSKCGKLCNNGDKCCHDNATCACGTYTGKYDCLCKAGFYGTGRGKTGCKPCPSGTYKNFTGQGGRSLCTSCPDEHQITPPGAQSEKQCTCKRGYRSIGHSTCKVARCQELLSPKHGYFINSKCNNVFNAACGLRCNNGYELHGSSLRICQENGTWSGQPAKCIMKTCPALPQPKNGHMICSTDDFSYSTVCRFTCNSGYQLLGSRKRTCLAIAFWTGIATRCREISCPPLEDIKDGIITPPSCATSEVIFGSVCHISCSQGYALKGPHTKQCTPDGTWMAIKEGPNQCIDDTPPVLHCPDNIEVMADEEDDTTQVSWRQPVPVDNSGLIPLLGTEPAVTPGSRFSIGITKILYRAEDLSKNVATCGFQINVVDKTPPRVDKCPTYAQFVSTKKKTTVSLKMPEFSDNSGKPVEFVSSKKSTDLFPIGTTQVTYTAFDASNNNSTCVVDVVVIPHLCVSPKAPVNGNVSCEEGDSSITCRIRCFNGYSFIDPIADQYSCDFKTGVWIPKGSIPFPDCAAVEESNDILQPATVTLTGEISCKDQKALLEIAASLEEEMKEKLSQLCANELSCSLGRLKSVCEDEESFNKIPVVVNKRRKKRQSNERRRKRSVSFYSLKQLRYKRQTKVKKSKISFDITLKGSLPKNEKSRKKMKDQFSETWKTILSVLQQQAKKKLVAKSKTLKIDRMSYDVEKVEYNCPAGSLLTNKTCIYCPVGTFHDTKAKLCEDCPRGTYQDKEGQISCIRCPDDKSTVNARARSIEKCNAVCKPGTFSSTGLEPCETCHQGFYQSDYSARTCFPCDEGTTTQRRGCSSDEKCAELCPPGLASKSGLAPCFPCPTSAYQPKSGQSECLKCPGGGDTGIRGATSLSLCIMPPDSWEIQSDGSADTTVPFNECDFENPCQNGGVCRKGEGSLFTCECQDGFGGQTCKDIIDHCRSEPCQNKGSCLSANGTFTCVCLDGFIGDICDINVNDCIPNQCQNGAPCEDGINSFRCRCQPGYTGMLCESGVGECESNPCLNSGNCTLKETEVSCLCSRGFSGEHCEIDIDECLDSPCSNGGTCVDLPGDFRCDCHAGFAGKACGVNVDDCEINPCQNGGECFDEINNFKCICPEGFDGLKCEEELTPYYQLDFINPSIMDNVQLSIDRPLNSVTASLWIKTTDQDNQGTPFSYGVQGQPDAFTITDYNNLNVYINGEQRSTGLPLNNGQWQHFVFTWSSIRGDWKVYVNGLLMDQGYDLSTSKAIPGKGVFIIGQEQDIEGGGFSAAETFVGSLTQLNIWDRELSLEDIEKLRFSCDMFIGNVIAWPDVRTALRGDVIATKSNFCQDIRYMYRNWRDIFFMVNPYL